MNHNEYSSYPQVADGYQSPGAKSAQYSDLEAVRDSRHNAPSRVNEPGRIIDEKDRGRRIFGFRPATFWLALALVLVIIIAAVVGGVAGALAGGDSNSNSNAGAAAHTTTKTIVATRTGTASATASSAVPTSGLALDYCKNSTTYTSTTGAKFQEFCAIDWAGGWAAEGGGDVLDLAIRTKGSFHACMDGCALYNRQNPKVQQCKAVGFCADLTYAIGQYGGNCWFKSGPATGDTLPVGTVDPEIHSVAQLLT